MKAGQRKEASIRQQLLGAILLTSGLVLLLAVAAFVVSGVISLRRNLAEHLTSLSRAIAENCAAPLAFGNAEDAVEVLGSLRLEPHLEAAALYDRQGRLFAKQVYQADRPVLPERPGKVGHHFGPNRIEVFQPVTQAGGQLGTLYLRSDLKALTRRLQVYGIIVVSIMAVSMLAGLLFSNRLQARISHPILALAETARTVTERSDYSVRAPVMGEGEVALLTETFNRMLGEIESSADKLRENQRQLQDIIDGAPSTVVFVKDLEGRYVTINRLLEQLLNISRAQMRGKTDFDLVTQDRAEFYRQHDAQVMASGQPGHFDEPLTAANGDERIFVCSKFPLRDNDGVAYALCGVATDITERKQAEEELRRFKEELELRVEERTAELSTANRELEAFSYSVSHDLRAPLRHMMSFAKLLDKSAATKLTDKERRHLQIINDAGMRMERLIDDLLTFSRIGRATVTKTTLNLKTVVDGARRELAPAMQGRDIEWVMNPMPEVSADQTLLHTVMVNLLSNAVKYTRGRTPARIEIGATSTEHEVRVYVRDNGAGFDMKFVDKLFGVFQRLHRPEDFEGTGIGLANVRRIIQRHGGRTWAEGEVGKGATFHFSLPR